LIYAVRFSPLAIRELAEAAIRIADITADEETGRAWYDGLKEESGTLAENPRRFQVQTKESRLIGAEARRLLYQRTKGSTHTYHLYYVVEDEGDDGPVVKILHIRHASRKPMTSTEAKDIRGGQ